MEESGDNLNATETEGEQSDSEDQQSDSEEEPSDSEEEPDSEQCDTPNPRSLNQKTNGGGEGESESKSTESSSNIRRNLRSGSRS
ncbi:PREDICTED: dentin matrix acidic phosphoprotein 1-like [Camelina sativa]|uniref:Dentin matrix acidic phosphoprotein 1-like n=1 Tax=Camelina sativa TaxID=90675 RepID=A0ABM0ZIS3_CAMSA|nr:PREDICTED: dentin matrix acidic phosphoprotein 1-like [Camelina sativa]